MATFRELEKKKPINYGTPTERKIDRFVGIFSPKLAMERMQVRAQANALKLHYDGGAPSYDRRPARGIQGPDDPLHQIQQIELFKRAADLARNDGFFKSIIGMFQTYCIGDLHYIPQVGTTAENQAYRDYWDAWTGECDMMGRDSFIEGKKLAYAGFMTFGDHGEKDYHLEDGSYKIQSVTGDCIGNPRSISVNERYIRGIVRDETGRPVGVHVYRRTLTDNYVFEQEIPYGIFTHYNPRQTSDEVKAKTPLFSVLNDLQDVREIENAWKLKIKWSGYKTGITNVPNGGFPDDSLDRGEGHLGSGRLAHMHPGEELIGEPGFQVTMLENNTPTQNELEAITNVLGRICAGVDLPLPWAWVVMGLPGTYTRLISKRAERTFQFGHYGQDWLARVSLTRQKNNAIFSGILQGKIPWTKNWSRGEFIFPPHPSTDEGYDSQAEMDEYRAGLRSANEIAAKRGRWYGDIRKELVDECQKRVQDAIDVADALNKMNPDLNLTWRDTINYLGVLSPNAKSPGDLIAPVNDDGSTKPALTTGSK